MKFLFQIYALPSSVRWPRLAVWQVNSEESPELHHNMGTGTVPQGAVRGQRLAQELLCGDSTLMSLRAGL